MSETAADEFQQRVLAALAAVEADNERLRAEVQELRVTMPSDPAEGRVPCGAAGAGGVRFSRGEFLRLGVAAAAAGAVGAGGSLLGAGPAGANQGNMQYGNDNNAGTFTTQLRSVHESQTLIIRNDGVGRGLSVQTTGETSIVAQTNSDSTLVNKHPRSAIVAQAKNATALVARFGDFLLPTGIGDANPERCAVLGLAEHASSQTSNTGVAGACDGHLGLGVVGKSDTGIGVMAWSDEGPALVVGGSGRVLQGTFQQGVVGPPTTGEFYRGESIRDAAGELWLCVRDYTDGAPSHGTWRRAATVREGFAGGSMNLLPKPIRLYDSRSGAKLAGGASVDVQVTGVVIGGVSVPTGAVGVVGNITVTQTQSPSGYLTLYAQGSPPNPATSNVNWFAADQNLNAAAVVALNPANGKMTIHNGIVGGSNPTHAVFDATAFVF